MSNKLIEIKGGNIIMCKVAVMGYGTIGSGVVEVLTTNKAVIAERTGEEVEVKYVLDLRDFPGSPVEKLLVKDYKVIVDDPEVEVVVETMGGVKPAYQFVKECLENGKNVCTSNKELVAAHGPELLQIARDKNVNFLFEASVGGGIPIIRPLTQCLTADVIEEITGILNGTTNFILTKMRDEGADFETVLKEAQELGYAERNPEADVEGYDACRKIAILTSLAYGKQVDYNDIYTEGITKITVEDFKYADSIGATIKLVGTGKMTDGKISAMVTPVMVKAGHPLYTVDDVFNGIYVRGNMLGDSLFYGKGAGKLPTASAVVADVVDEAKNLHENIATNWSNEPMKLTPMDETEGRFFVRVKGVTEAQAEAAFGKLQIVKAASLPDEFGFITECMKQKEYKEKISKLGGEVIAMIRVKD